MLPAEFQDLLRRHDELYAIQDRAWDRSQFWNKMCKRFVIFCTGNIFAAGLYLIVFTNVSLAPDLASGPVPIVLTNLFDAALLIAIASGLIAWFLERPARAVADERNELCQRLERMRDQDPDHVERIG